MKMPSAPFDAANSIYAGLSVIALKIADALTGVTGAAATDVFTKNSHGFKSGQGLAYVSGTGFTGLVVGTLYYVIAVDANTFKLAATYADAVAAAPTAVDVTLDGTVGVFQPVHIFEAAQLDDDPEQATKQLERPDAKGVLRVAREVETKAMEKWTFKLDEVKRLLDIFGGALRGRKNGTCTLWVPDTDDATGKVALKSEDDFAITVTRDGKLTFGNSDFSSATIKIESRKSGDVTWTRDFVTA